MNTNIEVLRELDELVEAARLLGATQAKKLFGEHTDEDSRFERAMYESIDKHRAALLDWEAKQPAACRCVDCGGDHHEHDSHCAYMREVHEAQQPAPSAPVGVEGTWLWGKLMDWCREQRIAPATQDKLFAIAGEAHRLNALAQQPAAEPKTLPVPTRVYLIGETAVIAGTPQRGWDEEGPDAHNCDDMGCSTFGRHVLARVPFTDERALPTQQGGGEINMDVTVRDGAWVGTYAEWCRRKQPAADQFIATFRCENNGIVGTTDAKVHSVTRHDDGRIEVVIDHWPKQPAAGDGAVCPNCERLTEIRHCQACGCDFIAAQHQEPKP